MFQFIVLLFYNMVIIHVTDLLKMFCFCYTLTVMFHSYMYVKQIIMVWFLFVRHSILSCLCQCHETNNSLLFYNMVIIHVTDLLKMFCFCNKYFLLMSICLIFVLYDLLNTLQNITKTLAQNYREGQTGGK
jgi:hypothetical protein